MATKYEENQTGDDYYDMAEGETYWQTFTVQGGEAHTITSVKLKGCRSPLNTGGTINLSIKATSGGSPTGAALCSGTIAFGAFPVYASDYVTDAGWAEGSLGNGTSLSASTQYAIEFTASGITPNPLATAVVILEDDSSPYAGGSTGGDLPGGDLLFEEWGDAVSPEIAALAMGAGGSFIMTMTNTGVWCSTDFGSNWTQRKPDGAEDIPWTKGICSGTGTYMVAERTSDGVLYRSANGGSSWATIDPTGGDTFSVSDMATSEDGQYMVVVGTNSTTAANSCYISTDYGATWTVHNPSPTAVSFTSCDISDDGEVIGVSAVGDFYMTFNGGTRWEQQYPPATNDHWNHIGISGDGKVGIIANTGDNNEWFKNSGWFNDVTVEQTPLTSFARTILDDSSSGDARTTLGAQQQGDVLDDLNTLGAATVDGEFIVATGPGLFAYESGNTARTSLGLGTGDSPIFTELTLTTADIEFTNRADVVLALQSTVSGRATGVEYYTQDGDGTDHCTFSCFGTGLPDDVANAEYCQFGWIASLSYFRLGAFKTGSGTARDLVFATSDYANHLHLDASTGYVGVGVAPTSKLTVDGAIEADSINVVCHEDQVVCHNNEVVFN